MSNMDFTNYLSGERKKQKLPVYFISFCSPKPVILSIAQFDSWFQLFLDIDFTLLPRLHLTIPTSQCSHIYCHFLIKQEEIKTSLGIIRLVKPPKYLRIGLTV